jgi:uncharacterized protein YpiB (UPF0302 family)
MSIPYHEKLNFISYFQKNHLKKSSNAFSVLNHLQTQNYLIKNVRFTSSEKKEGCLLVFSNIPLEKEFLFYYKGKKVDNLFDMIEVLNNHPSQPIYMMFRLKNHLDTLPFKHLVDTDFHDNMKRSIKMDKDNKELDLFLEQILLKNEINLLKQEIDESLDRRDYESFIELTERLKKINDCNQ